MRNNSTPNSNIMRYNETRLPRPGIYSLSLPNTALRTVSIVWVYEVQQQTQNTVINGI